MTYDPLYDSDMTDVGTTERIKIPVLQWHGGTAALAGEDSFRALGGWFMDDERILTLGLDPEAPIGGAERVSIKFTTNSKPTAGWGWNGLTFACIHFDFHWETREDGKRATPPDPKNIDYGIYRGRTRIIAVVKELADAGVTDPVMVSVRGTSSKVLNGAHRNVKTLAEAATLARKRKQMTGVVPAYAFWVEVWADTLQRVGKDKAKQSEMAPPVTETLPEPPDEQFIREHMVQTPDYIRKGGLFERYWQEYEDIFKVEGEQPVEELTRVQSDAVSQIRDGIVGLADNFVKEDASRAAPPTTAQRTSAMDAVAEALHLEVTTYAGPIIRDLITLCFPNVVNPNGTVAPNLAMVKAVEAFVTSHPYAPELIATWRVGNK